jgi:hypothetical protein
MANRTRQINQRRRFIDNAVLVLIGYHVAEIIINLF